MSVGTDLLTRHGLLLRLFLSCPCTLGVINKGLCLYEQGISWLDYILFLSISPSSISFFFKSLDVSSRRIRGVGFTNKRPVEMSIVPSSSHVWAGRMCIHKSEISFAQRFRRLARHTLLQREKKICEPTRYIFSHANRISSQLKRDRNE